MKKISNESFNYYQDLLLQKSGLSLSNDKTYLLITRLHPVATSLGYTDLDTFTRDLAARKDPSMINSVVDAMTTNETSFFRDTKPFNALKELLPDLMKEIKYRRTIRIWSAACSSGQEPYSLAIMMEEFLKNHPDWSYEIIATDISDRILDQAKKGEYGQFEIQRGLTIQMMVQYFTQHGTKWRINDDLKKHVSFKNLNLLDDMTSMGDFDVVFCRNVLIYFNSKTKTQVLKNLSQRITPHGLLFLGACETVVNLDVPLKTKPSYAGIFEPQMALPKAAPSRNAQEVSAI